MRVRDAMTSEPVTCDPSSSLREAALLMASRDCAAVPVTHQGRLVGIVTDRDIACRAVAKSDEPAVLPVASVMSAAVIAVLPDDPLDLAAELMRENAIHHLPVISREGALVGILAQSDIGRRMNNREFGYLVRETSIRQKYHRGYSAIVKA